MRAGALALLGVLLMPVTAHAAPSADELHRAGEAAYRGKEFQAAAAAFEAANAIEVRPQTTFSLAQSYRQLYVATREPGPLLRAVVLYRSYLAAVPRGARSDDARELLTNLAPLADILREQNPKLDAGGAPAATQLLLWSSTDGALGSVDRAAPVALPLLAATTPGTHHITISAPGYADRVLSATAVEKQLVPIEGRLDPHPGRLRLEAPSSAHFVVDDVPRGRRTELQLPPGSHEVWAGARGRLGSVQTVVLRPGATQAFRFDLPESPRHRATRAVFWTSVALTVASAPVLAYSAYRHHGASDLLDARQRAPWTPSQLDEYSDDRDSHHRWETVGIAALSVGVVGLAVAAALHLSDVPQPHD